MGGRWRGRSGEDRGAGSAGRGGYTTPLQADRGWCWPAAVSICLCGLLPCGPPPVLLGMRGWRHREQGRGLRDPLGRQLPLAPPWLSSRCDHGLSPGAPQQGLSALASGEEGPCLGGHSDVLCDC